MASNINPNNIDGAYPVAGQDNNSQGFRDNFTNIKTNFQYAEDEINDLETNVILKAALTGQTLDNNMNDNLIYAAKIQDFSATKVAVTATSGSIAINYASGHYQTIVMSSNISLSFTNFPATGSYGWIRLQIAATAGQTMTLPAAVSLGVTGIQGYSASVVTFAATGTYEFAFTTSDGGTTITVFDLNRPLNVFTNGLTSITPTNKIGYGTGAGGTITQGTNKSTAVTLDTVSGQITMNNATLNTDTTVSFTLNNTAIAAGDVLILNHVSGGTVGSYLLNAQAGASSAVITVRNITGGNLSEAIVIGYVVIKGVTS
jgi:hypothetical protein